MLNGKVWYKRHSTNEWIFSTAKLFRGRVKVELGLCNYATKANLKIQQVLIHQNLLKRLI